ncbi:MAG: hypothetical protein AB7G88_14630, partial [Thermomicrobiales bacterium]
AATDNERYEVISDQNGVAFFNDFYTAGTLTIAEQIPSDDFTAYEMHCSTSEAQTPLVVTDRGNGRAAASFELPQAIIDAGTGVYCDWFYFQGPPSVAAEAPAFGLGLTTEEWEEIYGTGAESGMVTLYANGRYVVGFTNGHVTSVTLTWEAVEEQSIEEASSAIAELLPPDAERTGNYDLPAGPDNDPGLHIERFASTLLATRLSGQPLLWDGSFLVIYQLAEGGERPLVTGVAIVAGRG